MIYYIDELDKLECPDCKKRMIVFFDNDVYVSHGCKQCKFFRELENNRAKSVCCGGGGNLEMADPDLSTKVAGNKIEEIPHALHPFQ